MNLVTGATGHVGNVLVRQLLARGERVRAMVLPSDDLTSLAGLDVEVVEGNVLDPESLDRAMKGVDAVYHLAGIISIAPGDEELMWRVNVEGVRNVAAAAMRARVDRVVHVSSVHAFKRMPDGVVVDERIPLALDNPAGTYDHTKALGTLAMLEAAKLGLNVSVVCPTAIIGPYDYRGSLLGTALLGFARRGLHWLVPGAYDFVDVRDIANGLILTKEKGQSGEIYILAGTYATLPQVEGMVQRVAGVRAPRVILPWNLAMAAARVMQHLYRTLRARPQFTPYSLRTLRENARFSGAKAQRELGYQRRPLLQTLRDLITWRRGAQIPAT